MTLLRTAIIGLNHYHVTGWTESLASLTDQIDVVARYDPDPTRKNAPGPEFVDPSLSQIFPAWIADTPFYSSLPQLIEAEKPDLALVTLPNTAAPLAIATLANHGVHLLVDKPGARNGRAAASAFGAARESGVKHAVAFTRRYGRPWQAAAAELKANRLGPILTAEAIFVTSSVAVRNPANPIFNREQMGGGILHWLGVHDIDLLLWLGGQPIVEVQAMASTSRSSAIDVEDTISVAFRYASGALGTMHFAYALPRPAGEGYLALRGTDQSLRIEPSGVTTWTGAGSAQDPLLKETTSVETATLPGYGSVGVRIIDDLIQAISEDREPLATGRHAVAALRVIDAIYESARTGKRVSVSAPDGERR